MAPGAEAPVTVLEMEEVQAAMTAMATATEEIQAMLLQVCRISL